MGVNAINSFQQQNKLGANLDLICPQVGALRTTTSPTNYASIQKVNMDFKPDQMLRKLNEFDHNTHA